MIRAILALGVLALPSAASADLLFVNGEQVAEFPSCQITLETRYGEARVRRTLSKGSYLIQDIFWSGTDIEAPAGFYIGFTWRRTRTSGLSEGPVLLIGQQKNGSTILSRSLEKNSTLVLKPAVADATSETITYGPLTRRKSKYRTDFAVDAVDLVNRLATQEKVVLELTEPAKGGEAKVHRGELSLNLVRAFLEVDSNANRLLDEWQSGGGVNCPVSAR